MNAAYPTDAPQIATRQPTGRPAWPLILVEGEEKAGKSVIALSLSRSPHIGRMFAFDTGDGAADEYAELGPYEIIDTDGTYTDLHNAVKLATQQRPHEGRPNVVLIDSGSDLWDALKAWTDQRARMSRNGVKALRDDPDAVIDPSMNLWNDAKDRWSEIVSMLRLFPGIGIITAQGREVSKVQGGVPVAGQTEWSIQAEKTTTAQASAWVRVRRDPRSARLIGLRKLGLTVPAGGLELPLTNTLEHLVFELLAGGHGAGSFDTVRSVQQVPGVSTARAKTRLLEAVGTAHPDWPDTDRAAEARRLWAEAKLPARDAEITPEQLADLITAALAAPAEAAAAAAPAPVAATADPPAGDQSPETAQGHTEAAPSAPVAAPVAPPASTEDAAQPLAGPAPKALTVEAVSRMTKIPLVEQLTARGLPTNGTQDALRARLTAAVAEEAAPADGPLSDGQEAAADALSALAAGA